MMSKQKINQNEPNSNRYIANSNSDSVAATTKPMNNVPSIPQNKSNLIESFGQSGDLLKCPILPEILIKSTGKIQRIRIA